MKRAACSAFALLLLTSCKIERTPEEYIDPGDPVVQLRERTADDLNARMLELSEALERGDAGVLLAALELDPEVFVVADGQVVRGETEVRTAIGSFLAGAGPLRVHDLQLTVAPRSTAAWFRASAESADQPDASPMWLTGVISTDGESWRLVQAHLSREGDTTGDDAPRAEADF